MDCESELILKLFRKVPRGEALKNGADYSVSLIAREINVLHSSTHHRAPTTVPETLSFRAHKLNAPFQRVGSSVAQIVSQGPNRDPRHYFEFGELHRPLLHDAQRPHSAAHFLRRLQCAVRPRTFANLRKINSVT